MITIETERLRLRRLEPRDAHRLAEYRSDAAIARYQSWETMTLDEAQELIRALPAEPLANIDEWSQLAIADAQTDEILGDIGVCRRPPGNIAEIGFTLAPHAQRRGLAAEACRAVIELLFAFPEVGAIKAVVDGRNTPAIALVQRLGMTLEHPESVEFKGARCTELHFVVRGGSL